MNEEVKQYEVVIVGGGFAGIQAAHTLAKKDLPIVITLITNTTCFQYYPSLYRVVVGAPAHQVSIPLIYAAPRGARVVEDTYVSLDQNAHTITLKSGKIVNYDYLILALGSEPNYFGINGMEEQSKSFLSIEKALGLRNYYIDLVKKAKTLSREEAKLQLSTIIVGAGPSGTEMAGALPGFLKKLAKQYGVNPALVHVTLLDGAARPLPALPAKGSAKIEKRLKKKGVTFLPNHGVNSCGENSLKVTDKTPNPTSAEATAGKEKELHAGTVIWTAGTKINSAFASIPNVVMTDRKRVQVSPTLTLPNDDHVYIAGDGAGTPYSGLAQTAINTGSYVANAIAKQIRNEAVEPYEPKRGIFVIPVGKGWAIYNYKNFVATGFLPWLLRIAIDGRYFLTITSLKHVFSMLRKEK